MLTDIKCRTEKAVGDKEKKISDGFGLYLLVKPSGTKLWQMAYRFNGRQKKLSFGIYGSDDEGRVSLATARKKRDEAKALIAKGIDPGVARKEERLEKATARPLASWADEWLAKQEAECGEGTMKGKRRFVGYLKDEFGSSMIGDITVEKVVAYLKTLQNQGKLETRDRVRAAGEGICKFADLKTNRAQPIPRSRRFSHRKYFRTASGNHRAHQCGNAIVPRYRRAIREFALRRLGRVRIAIPVAHRRATGRSQQCRMDRDRLGQGALGHLGRQDEDGQGSCRTAIATGARHPQGRP